MYPAVLAKKMADSRVRCNICRWRCLIASGKLGVCRMYRNESGNLFNLNYAMVSSAAVDPVEKKPLYHFYPGSLVFSLGSWGCNFHCAGCQNWQIACADMDSGGRASQPISPAQAVKTAVENNCRGIAWTYNEPTVWLEYTVESARLAKEKGLYTVYVTNGYITPEALDLLGPFLDAWRVDIKGFNSATYRKIAKIRHWEGILETAERAKNKWNMHVEVVTNVTPSVNDDDEQLRGIANWIKTRLGELTPWHVTRFYPQYQAVELPPTPLKALERAWQIGQASGLKFVYTGNVPGHDGENTHCFRCGRLVIKRLGYNAQLTGLKGDKCRDCGAEMNIRL
ncbi:MAG TPA: AmmeMemoRadiSam system radical SAM enzyme [Dehalococcoidales bacterium]|nr:AmmeMemoRadiSam system radical SAM enzyme [Dehalococcoidales bacterium]